MNRLSLNMRGFALFHVIGCLAGVCFLTVPACAGEYVVLGNGFQLHADRHEVDGTTVRIFSDGGVTEMPAGSVAGYEQEEITPAPAAPPQAALPTTPALPVTPETPAEMAAAAAKKARIPDAFIRSVMKAESGFRADAVSPKGAVGLMQLMPGTAQELGVDPKNPHQNVEGGAEYLRELLAKYEDDPNQVLLALAAYNAGPAAVDHYHGVPPYRETREYILRVLKNWNREGSK
jgi:pyruvate/2-oxoglutarate dehydrogenase complex dihydrolipoamide acyltransferase (E2) component